MNTIICDNPQKIKQEMIKTLAQQILHVCRKLDFDDSSVTWLIYDPLESTVCNPTSKTDIGTHTDDYCHCDIDEKKIYISTFAIGLARILTDHDKCDRKSPVNNILAELIIEEISKVQTCCSTYNNKVALKRRENIFKYYNT